MRQAMQIVQNMGDLQTRRLAEKISLRKTFGRLKPCQRCSSPTGDKNVIVCIEID